MRWSVTLFLIMGCAAEIPTSEADFGAVDSEVIEACGEEWVCWNPGSALHGQSCSDKCMEKGDNTKYCYLISDCERK